MLKMIGDKIYFKYNIIGLRVLRIKKLAVSIYTTLSRLEFYKFYFYKLPTFTQMEPPHETEIDNTPTSYSYFIGVGVYNAVVAYSFAESIAKKMYGYACCFYKQHIMKHPHFHTLLDYTNMQAPGVMKHNLQFIKNGKTIWYSNVENRPRIHKDAYDFILYSKHADNGTTICSRIVHDWDDLFDLSDSLNTNPNLQKQQINESSMRFLYCSVGEHTFTFKTDEYDFYVEGNVFSPAFMEYFFNQHYEGVPKYPQTDTCDPIKLMDETINTTDIGADQHVVITDTFYKVVEMVKEKEEDTDEYADEYGEEYEEDNDEPFYIPQI